MSTIPLDHRRPPVQPGLWSGIYSAGAGRAFMAPFWFVPAAGLEVPSSLWWALRFRSQARGIRIEADPSGALQA